MYNVIYQQEEIIEIYKKLYYMQIVLNIVHSTIPIIHRAFYDSYRTLYILRFLSYIVYFTIPIIHRTFYYPYHTSCILLFLSYIVHFTIPIIHRTLYDSYHTSCILRYMHNVCISYVCALFVHFHVGYIHCCVVCIPFFRSNFLEALFRVYC